MTGRIETTDLVLRLPAEDDAAAVLRLMHDPEVVRWNPRDCPDLAAAAQWCRDNADWSEGRHASWLADDRATGRLAGTVSLFAIDAGDACAKIGYRVVPESRGRGVARQLVRAAVEWGFTERGLARVQLEHAVANAASCRVATAAGFVLEGTLRSAYAVPEGGREDVHVHGRLVDDA